MAGPCIWVEAHTSQGAPRACVCAAARPGFPHGGIAKQRRCVACSPNQAQGSILCAKAGLASAQLPLSPDTTDWAEENHRNRAGGPLGCMGPVGHRWSRCLPAASVVDSRRRSAVASNRERMRREESRQRVHCMFVALHIPGVPASACSCTPRRLGSSRRP